MTLEGDVMMATDNFMNSTKETYLRCFFDDGKLFQKYNFDRPKFDQGEKRRAWEGKAVSRPPRKKRQSQRIEKLMFVGLGWAGLGWT